MMSSVELTLCLIAVLTSSVSQLCLKSFSHQKISVRSLLLLVVAGLSMLFSIIVVVWVLRTIYLSQLMPFAAGAYILVPLGGKVIFNENLEPKFWVGVVIIISGILFTTYR